MTFIQFPPGGGGSSGSDPDGSYVVVSGSAAPASARIIQGTGGVSIVDSGPGSIVTVSGTLGAPMHASYVILSSSGGTGSDPPVGRILAAGVNVSIVDGGPGNPVTINAGTSGGSGDPNASYVVLSATGSLSSERVLTAGAGISITDGGAGAALTIATTGAGFADVSASYVVIGATGSLPNERVLTAGTNISIVDSGAGGAITISAATGSTWTPFTNIYTVTASYVLDSRPGVTDNTLLITTTAHNVTCSLPAPTSGRSLLFKDFIGSSSNYPFMVTPTGGAKIDNISSSYSYYANFGVLKLFSNGTDWFTW